MPEETERGILKFFPDFLTFGAYLDCKSAGFFLKPYRERIRVIRNFLSQELIEIGEEEFCFDLGVIGSGIEILALAEEYKIIKDYRSGIGLDEFVFAEKDSDIPGWKIRGRSHRWQETEEPLSDLIYSLQECGALRKETDRERLFRVQDTLFERVLARKSPSQQSRLVDLYQQWWQSNGNKKIT